MSQTPHDQPWQDPQRPVDDRADARREDLAPRDRRPAREAYDRDLDGHSTGPGAGVWTTLIIGILLLIALAVFIMQNMQTMDINFLGWTGKLAAGVAMLLAAIAGALVMALVGSVRMFSMSRRVRKLEKERSRVRDAMSS